MLTGNLLGLFVSGLCVLRNKAEIGVGVGVRCKGTNCICIGVRATSFLEKMASTLTTYMCATQTALVREGAGEIVFTLAVTYTLPLKSVTVTAGAQSKT